MKYETLCNIIYNFKLLNISGNGFKWRCVYLPINSLWPSDTIWRHRSGSTFVQAMTCCLTAPRHYLNQCWLPIEDVQRHSSENNFTWSAHKLNPWHVFGNYTLPVTTTSPRDQWVNIWNKNVRFAVLPVVLWVIYNVSWTMKIWGPPPT